jgi:hypothetical protein
MATLLVFHEVDDVDEWLKSPRREQIFGPASVTARLFRDPQGSNRADPRWPGYSRMSIAWASRSRSM